MSAILIDKKKMHIEELVAVARHGAEARLSTRARARLERGRALVDKWVSAGRIIYGITTGFGALCNTLISQEETRQLQANIIMSHAAGVGRPLPTEVVRAVMATRARDLSGGHAGVRPEVVEYLLAFLKHDVRPVVPEKGSVGASGDLAPMAHLALAMIGPGQVIFRDRLMTGAEALALLGRLPLRLEAGEGLALINGTQIMTAIGALAVADAARLARLADVACALSLEVLMGSDAEFDPRIHLVRPHPGQITAAANLRALTHGSEIVHSHKDCSRVQDAYTLRCSPQIHGASRDAIDQARRVIEIELNSTTTNPLIFPDTEDFVLGGNFHGQPIALVMDYLGMALAELANVSERRIERLVNPQLSDLPAFLVTNTGLNSGYMIAQYTAAALVSENKILAHPASVDSIPTSANKEDHVSMGTIAARKCREILENAEHVLAVELLCAAQAMDLLCADRDWRAGEGTGAAFRAIRDHVPYLEEDRVVSRDIETMVGLMREGVILTAVEARVGPLA